MELYDSYQLIPAEENEYSNRDSKEYQVFEWVDEIANDSIEEFLPYSPHCDEITICEGEKTTIIRDYESVEFYVLDYDDKPFWIDAAEFNENSRWDHRRLGPYRKKSEFHVTVFDAETGEKTIYTLSNKEIVPMNLEEKLKYIYHEKPKSLFDKVLDNKNDTSVGTKVDKQESEVSSELNRYDVPF